MSSPQVTLDFHNIQGDVLQGLIKRVQLFIFFTISDPDQFKLRFKEIIPFITTTAQVLEDEKKIAAHKGKGGKGLVKITETNVGFSSKGLLQLGITDDLNDPFFTKGQRADALGRFQDDGLTDPLDAQGDVDWDDEFKQDIHGVLTIAGDSEPSIERRRLEIDAVLADAVDVVLSTFGRVRPGREAGHEHFGFQDGLSQPPVRGFRAPNAGEDPVDPGVVLLGEPGDANARTGQPTARPAWAKDSSFLVFRKLRQAVPEFNDFLKKNPIPDPGLTPAQGSELLGARMVGRWKSGAPIDRDPVQDNLADTTPDKVNDFDYSDDPNEVRCPFASHLRKMNPRNSKPVGAGGFAGVRPRRIIRQGITYGPEVTEDEAESATTLIDRGLFFVCYQSSIEQGFHFLQRSWANNINFPPIPTTSTLPKPPGFDPIIGLNDGARTMTGFDPQTTSSTLNLPPAFVVPRGGEYFLAPTIKALKETITA